MKNFSGLVITLLFALTLNFGAVSDAEARRFGGGSSFGGRSAYSMPYKRSMNPQQSRSSQQKQSQTAQQSQGARQSWANRGGLMGMLGGLAIGGLLGSLFMGGGFHGINFFDFLIFGSIAYFLYRMLAARNSAQKPSYNRSYGSGAEDTTYQDKTFGNPASQNSQAGFNTDLLFDRNKNSASTSQTADAEFITDAIPAGFDASAFIDGAKIAYKTLQQAWDERDLAEIRSLTTDKVFVEIQEQLHASAEDNKTDILKLDAELLEVREIGSDIEAVVLFDAILREAQDTQAGQVREVWHFTKPNHNRQTKWLLDGIQQLED